MTDKLRELVRYLGHRARQLSEENRHDDANWVSEQAAALRELIEQKPVAWLYRLFGERVEIIDQQLDHYYDKPGGGYIKGEPLYALPVAQPSTESRND